MILHLLHRMTWFQPDALSGKCTGFIAIVLASIMISACDIVDEMFVEPPPPPCPSVSILGNAERITQFHPGPGRDLIDITAEARIDDFVAQCIYAVDDETGVGQVHVELSLGITAARGAANDQGFAEIPYFIVMTDLKKNVLNKKTFVINAVFEGNRYRLSAYDDPVILSAPIKPPLTGKDYRIFVGFQLTPDQLDYNKFLRQSGN